MKKLAIYIPSIETGGVEKNLLYISDYLSKKDIKIYIITTNYNKKKNFNKKINFITPKNNKWINSSRMIKTLICVYLILTKMPKKDISIFSFQSNFSSIILSKIIGVKIIIRLNTSLDKYINNPIKRFFFRVIYSMSNKIITNGLDFKKNLKKVLNLHSVYIYNPINLKKKAKNNKIIIKNFINFGGLKVLSIGRLTDQKDQITILKALNILKKKKINFRFCLIGGGYKIQELKEYIKKNKLSNYVQFLGYKKNASDYLSFSDLFVLSSKYEGLPNVIIEAQLKNIPIISSNCSTGPKEILLGQKLGTLFKVGDYLSLSNEIMKFNRNNKSFLKKANLAKKYLYRFDYEKNLNKYYKVIKQIL